MSSQSSPVSLIVQKGPNPGQGFTIHETAQTVGRHSASDIVISDPSLSRKHAKIYPTVAGVMIEDLGSANGTFVNGRRISSPTPIAEGDTIQLGAQVVLMAETGELDDDRETLLPGTVMASDLDMPTALDVDTPTELDAPPLDAPTELDTAPELEAPTYRVDQQPTQRDATYVPGSPSAPDATYVPPSPASSGQKEHSPWFWVVIAVVAALLILGGAFAYVSFNNAAPVPTEVAQSTATPTDTPEPEPTEPEETSPAEEATPTPLQVPGVAGNGAQEQAFPDGVDNLVDAFCDDTVEVAADEPVYIHWEQPLAEADNDTDYLAQWLDVVYYDISVDGRPVIVFNYELVDDTTLEWWANLGLLQPGTHFIRIERHTSRPVSTGLDLEPADGQMDNFGPGLAGEGSCEVVVPEPPTATTAPTATPTPEAEDTPEPTPTRATVAQSRTTSAAPLGVFQNFETQSSWRRGDQPYGTFARSSSQVRNGSFAGELNYDFPSVDNDFVVFTQNRALAGRPNGISAWVYGDGEGHFLNAWIKDANNQVWGMSFGQIKHTGWQEMTAILDPGQPWPSGHISGPDNGAIDYPISFQALALDDGSDDFRGRGTIYIDDLNSQEGATAQASSSSSSSGNSSGSSGSQTSSGNQTGSNTQTNNSTQSTTPSSSDYYITLGSQHRYEEPWGAPVDGNPCRAWQENKWDDENPNFRGFNVEILLTNDSSIKITDDWGEDMRFVTASGQEVRACYYGYDGAGPPPDGETSLTFFSVVPRGDFVQTMELSLNGQVSRLCLDGRGGASRC